MHIDIKSILVGAASIILVDCIASLLSVQFHISYILFLPVIVAVYFGVTYWAAKHLDLRSSLTFDAFLGFIDGTIGWKLSTWLGADPARRLEKATFSAWCATVVFVIIMGAVIAAIAFLVASRKNRRETR